MVRWPQNEAPRNGCWCCAPQNGLSLVGSLVHQFWGSYLLDWRISWSFCQFWDNGYNGCFKSCLEPLMLQIMARARYQTLNGGKKQLIAGSILEGYFRSRTANLLKHLFGRVYRVSATLLIRRFSACDLSCLCVLWGTRRRFFLRGDFGGDVGAAINPPKRWKVVKYGAYCNVQP